MGRRLWLLVGMIAGRLLRVVVAVVVGRWLTLRGLRGGL